MLTKLVTAQDGEKKLSVEYNLLSKEWKISRKTGKPIYCVPSDRVYIKVEGYSEEEKKSKLAELKAYAKERFTDSRYDVKLSGGIAYLAFCRDCEEHSQIELEPFALARLFSLYEKEGFVIDWGRRKTVFVEVVNGLLRSFRVVLRGGDYMTHRLMDRRFLDYQQAEELKRSEGLDLEEVRQTVKEVLELSGYDLEGKKVLLTGGGSKLKGLKELFPHRVELIYCEPEYAVCLGACIREVLKNPYPDFAKRELSQQDLRRLAYLGAGTALGVFLSLFAMHRLYSVEELREVQRAEFKRLFPREPIVSLHQQVKAKVSAGEEYRLTKLLLKAQENLREGMKLYSFEYADGKLTIRGEADRKVLEGLRLHSTKETPTGKVEFELKVP